MDNEKKTAGRILSEKLRFELKNCWTKVNSGEYKEIFEFSRGYMDFLDNAKTEREFASEAIKLLTEKGYVCLDKMIDEGIKLKEASLKIAKDTNNKFFIDKINGHLKDFERIKKSGKKY